MREIKQQGCEHRQECYKTIDFHTEYIVFKWEVNQLDIFPSSSLVTKLTSEAQFSGFTENVNNKLGDTNQFIFRTAFRGEFQILHVHTPSRKIIKKRTRSTKEKEKGK